MTELYEASTLEEIDLMISDVYKREGKLTEWEEEFMDHMRRIRKDDGTLNQEQDLKLTEIWDKLTS